MVIGVPAHRFQIIVLAADTQAFLRAGGANIRKPLSPEEHIFELDHAGVGKQQRRVLVRHERRAFHHRVALLDEIIQKRFANFVSGRHTFYASSTESRSRSEMTLSL